MHGQKRDHDVFIVICDPSHTQLHTHVCMFIHAKVA